MDFAVVPGEDLCKHRTAQDCHLNSDFPVDVLILSCVSIPAAGNGDLASIVSGA